MPIGAGLSAAGAFRPDPFGLTASLNGVSSLTGEAESVVPLDSVMEAASTFDAEAGVLYAADSTLFAAAQLVSYLDGGIIPFDPMEVAGSADILALLSLVIGQVPTLSGGATFAPSLSKLFAVDSSMDGAATFASSLSKLFAVDSSMDGAATVTADLTLEAAEEELFPAMLTSPISLAYDAGTQGLWVSATNGDNGLDGQYLQRIDTTLASPAVVARIDMFAYGLGGQGDIYVPVRQVRAYGGYIFACVLSEVNTGDGAAEGFCVILDATTNAIVGHVRTFYVGGGGRQADVRSVVFDGAGNFYISQTPASGGPHQSYVHKYSITGVISAYPSYGTPTASCALTDPFIEEMSFGGGYIWLVRGQKELAVTGHVTRIDPSTMTETTYAFGGSYTGWQAWAVHYAFGYVWVGASPGSATPTPLLRFDPGTWPADPVSAFAPGVNMHISGGMTISDDGTYLWFGGYQSGGNYWRIDPSTPGNESIVGTVALFRPADGTYDGGSHLWVISRNDNTINRIDISSVGSETVNYTLEDGGPPLDEPLVPVVWTQPVSVAYASGYLWTADQSEGIINKVSPTRSMPGAVGTVDLTGMGVSQVREIKYDSGSGYLFASCMDSRLVVIIDPATSTVVGFMNLFADGFLTSGRARSVTFDGTGKVWTLDRESGGPSRLRSYVIADVVAAYPSEGSQVDVYDFTHHMEQLSFGGGYIWAGGGVNTYFSPGAYMDGDAYDATVGGGLLMRVDPATGTMVAHIGNGAGVPPASINGHQVWNANYIAGVVWTSDQLVAIGRWDPSLFEPRDPGEPSWLTSRSFLDLGEYAGEPAVDDTGRIWVGAGGGFQRRVHRLNPADLGAGFDTTIQTFGGCSSDGAAFDGQNIWFTSRVGGSDRPAGLFRMLMTLGQEQADYRIIAATEYIAGITPDRHLAANATPIVIRGFGFATATGVTIGGVSATSFVVVSDTEITCESPSGQLTGEKTVVVQRPSTDLTFGRGMSVL